MQCIVCLLAYQLLLVLNYTAWYYRQHSVRNLPKDFVSGILAESRMCSHTSANASPTNYHYAKHVTPNVITQDCLSLECGPYVNVCI